jgi:hypothetical protein
MKNYKDYMMRNLTIINTMLIMSQGSLDITLISITILLFNEEEEEVPFIKLV